jgi:hypothetical protein
MTRKWKGSSACEEVGVEEAARVSRRASEAMKVRRRKELVAIAEEESRKGGAREIRN